MITRYPTMAHQNKPRRSTRQQPGSTIHPMVKRILRFIGNRFIRLGAALLALSMDDWDDTRATYPDGGDVTKRNEVPRWN
jgi:hypothetical protein